MRCKLCKTICEAFYFVLMKGMMAVLVLMSSIGVCRLSYGMQTPSSSIVVLRLQFYKLWFRQVPRRILTNAGKLANFITSYFMHIAWSYIFFFFYVTFMLNIICVNNVFSLIFGLAFKK